MGASLPKGGPAGLFLGFLCYGSIILCVNQCFGTFNFSCRCPFAYFAMLTISNLTAEMVTYLPIASPFIRLSGFWVDEALSFAMGWNYFFLMGT
jgi:yeast amino acid transporter